MSAKRNPVPAQPLDHAPASEDKALEREKLRAELDTVKLGNRKLESDLKSARLQKWLAFGTGAISAIVALAAHWADIKGIFVAKPTTTLAVTTTDKFLRDTAQVNIDDAIHVKLSEATALDVAPGSHHVNVIVGDEEVMASELIVKSGEARQLVLGDNILRKVHVVVSDQRSEVHAGESMELSVAASGTGYAWVFRSEPGNKCALAFPFHSDGRPLEINENLVGPQSRLTFPRPSSDGAILAPSAVGPASLYVVVTSINDPSQAVGIVGHYCDIGVTKAPEPDLKENWGMEKISFTVI
jgi:hypothetical protein